MSELTFEPLAKIFPDDRFDQIGKLFDDSIDRCAGEDQWKLMGLTVLLGCLENCHDGTDLSVRALRTLRALQAAYYLGKTNAIRRPQQEVP